METKTSNDVIVERIKWVYRYFKGEFAHRDKEVILLDKRTEEHFKRLNGEYARIDKVIASTVSKDVYDRDLEELRKIIADQAIVNEKLLNELKGKITPKGLWTAVLSGATLIGIVFSILNNIF